MQLILLGIIFFGRLYSKKTLFDLHNCVFLRSYTRYNVVSTKWRNIIELNVYMVKLF